MGQLKSCNKNWGIHRYVLMKKHSIGNLPIVEELLNLLQNNIYVKLLQGTTFRIGG